MASQTNLFSCLPFLYLFLVSVFPGVYQKLSFLSFQLLVNVRPGLLTLGFKSWSLTFYFFTTKRIQEKLTDGWSLSHNKFLFFVLWEFIMPLASQGLLSHWDWHALICNRARLLLDVNLFFHIQQKNPNEKDEKKTT